MDYYRLWDLEYSADEDALYVISSMEMMGKRQFVFDRSSGDEIDEPDYLIASDSTTRWFIDFDGGNPYSFETDYLVDSGTSASYIYDLENENVMGVVGENLGGGGFEVSGNKIAYHLVPCGEHHGEGPDF